MKFEVGKVYMTRKRNVVRLDHIEHGSTFPLRGTVQGVKLSWTIRGNFIDDSGSMNELDLASEVPEQLKLINLYHCHSCNISWDDTWSCACNDRCPKCNKETEPEYSEDLNDDNPD